MSGSSGAVYGVRVLEVLNARYPDIETHLIVSDAAKRTIEYELDRPSHSVEHLASVVHREGDVAAAIASGTFVTDGMVVAPCSIRTLSAIATSHSNSLLTRAADVCLKERRRLVLVVRETPLHLNHLRLMVQVTEAGAIVAPPCPGFYHRPRTLDSAIDHTVVKVLDLLGFHPDDLIERWTGL